MRAMLIKLLREVERYSSFENEYHDAVGTEEYDYLVEEHVDFPNYRSIDSLFVRKYLFTNRNATPAAPSKLIQAELKRMVADGIVLIGTQEGVKYPHTTNSKSPNYDEGIVFTTESVVLTTKGRSSMQYLFYQVIENPFSVMAIIISLISLGVSIVMNTSL